MKRFIECLIPIATCNLHCSYCYVEQQNRFKKKQPQFNYSVDTMVKALSKERLGGISFLSLTGSGESLLPKEMPELVEKLLQEGHFLNITTNGTFSKRFDELISINRKYLKHLHFSFSCHYIELKRTGNLDTFFSNILKIKEAGCSFLLQINLCDDYIDLWEEIKERIKKEVGAYPQVALTRDESEAPKKYSIYTKRSEEEYVNVAREVESPLFEFTYKNFMVKQKEFCYAGAWSRKLDLSTGELSGCYGYGINQNIFEDIVNPIKFEAIGKCPFTYCFNSSHFLSLGVIPSKTTPTYGELRDRASIGWYSDEMKSFLNERLYDDNEQYSMFNKVYVIAKYRLIRLKNIKNRISRLISKIKEEI